MNRAMFPLGTIGGPAARGSPPARCSPVAAGAAVRCFAGSAGAAAGMCCGSGDAAVVGRAAGCAISSVTHNHQAQLAMVTSAITNGHRRVPIVMRAA